MTPERPPDLDPSFEPWTEDERQRFLRDRASLLRRLLRNRQTWLGTVEQPAGFSTLQVTWIDHGGDEQQTLLTGAFLAGYATVMRALASDLILCGEDGARIAEQLFADLSGLDAEQET